TWAPQRLVWVAVALSLLGGLVCLALMIRRPRQRREPPILPDDGRPAVPELHLPWPFDARLPPPGGSGGEGEGLAEGRGRRRPVVVLAVTAALGGLFAVLNRPTTGPVLRGWAVPGELIVVTLAAAPGVALFVTARARRAAGVLALGGAALLALTALYIVAFQWRRRYAPDFLWSANFPWAHTLGLVAVLLLGAEGVRDLLRRS